MHSKGFFLVMKSFPFAACLILAATSLFAQAAVWQPSAGHTQIPIWPGKVPDAQPVPGTESIDVSKHLVAGKSYLYISNVSQPTMTVYPPKGKNTGAAVLVFPGGGFQVLAIDLEGTEVCDWLTSNGITCVLLKYRVPSLPYDWHCDCRTDDHVLPTQALEDAQRTLGLVRLHAKAWHIDPHRIGVIGFSAGGYLVAEISTQFQHRLYKPVDAADKVSCRPDFAMAIYPGHLDASGVLNPNVPVSHDTPPTFLVQAEDDHVDGVRQSLTYYAALEKAGVPAEMHLYAQGGHAFGLRATKFPITRWPRLAEQWLQSIGMIPE
jgi:acetyl esterase/lipase